MNLMQAVIDAISTVTQVPAGTAMQFGYEVYPDIFQTIQSLEHLKNATDMIITDPMNVHSITHEFELARQAGEFDRLVDELQQLGWIGVKEGYSRLAGESAASLLAWRIPSSEITLEHWKSY